MMNENDCILSVRGLDIRFNLRGRVLHAIRHRPGPVPG